MDNHIFGALVLGMLLLAVIIYGVLSMLAAKAIHESQAGYYRYLKQRHQRNLADYYTKEDLK